MDMIAAMAASSKSFDMIADEQCNDDFDDMKWKMKASGPNDPAFVYHGNASPFPMAPAYALFAHDLDTESTGN